MTSNVQCSFVPGGQGDYEQSRAIMVQVKGLLHAAAALASIASGKRSVHQTQCVLAGVPKPPGNNLPKAEEQWQDLAFPTYLQSEVDDFCQDWDEALQVTLQANESSPVCSLARALPVRDEHKCVCSWKNVGSRMLLKEM